MSTTSPSPAPAPLTAGLSTALWRPALVLFLALSAITGLIYPYAVTGISQTVFKDQANGSLIMRQGQAVGSRLIGQSFSDPSHFWSRPSATGPMAYNASNSSGSNLGPSNPALVDAVKARVAALRALDPDNHRPIPIDLVTASASGLDPHISRAAADYQIPRVARQTHLSQAQVKALVDEHTLGTWLGFMGEPQVNVLELNLALDEAQAHAH